MKSLERVHNHLSIACNATRGFQCPLRLFHYNCHSGIAPLGGPERKAISEMAQRVSKEVGLPHLYNEYECHTAKEIVERMALSIFVLSGRGSHFDCFRHWESVMASAIPLMSAHHSLHDIFRDLPVVQVSVGRWEVLDWAMLRQELFRLVPCINGKPCRSNGEFQMEKLMARWWIDKVLHS